MIPVSGLQIVLESSTRPRLEQLAPLTSFGTSHSKLIQAKLIFCVVLPAATVPSRLHAILT